MDADYLLSDQLQAAPAPLSLRQDRFAPHTEFSRHRHPWGQLSRISLGVIEIQLDAHKLLAPAQYLVWVPAEVAHASYARQAMAYTSVYIGAQLASRLPAQPCLIEQTPLIRALLDDFCQRCVSAVSARWDVLQAELLVEQLVRAGHQDSYLPDSNDRQLQAILQAIHLEPGDATTLAQWALRVHSTERTLARRFQRELGMSFLQWRNRVRLLQALAWLKQGRSVQDIAAQLGYGSASAFIAMFSKQLGLSPERYRRQMLA